MNSIQGLYTRKITEKVSGVFTSSVIYKGTIVESCDWIPISQRMQLLINKNDSSLAQRLFPNPDGLKKEQDILIKFAELDLQERLDRGLITVDQLKSILMDTVNPEKMLHVVSHAILLGFGSVYRTSERPNLIWDYNTNSKLYEFTAVEDINQHQELTYFSK